LKREDVSLAIRMFMTFLLCMKALMPPDADENAACGYLTP